MVRFVLDRRMDVMTDGMAVQGCIAAWLAGFDVTAGCMALLLFSTAEQCYRHASARLQRSCNLL